MYNAHVCMLVYNGATITHIHVPYHTDNIVRLCCIVCGQGAPTLFRNSVFLAIVGAGGIKGGAVPCSIYVHTRCFVIQVTIKSTASIKLVDCILFYGKNYSNHQIRNFSVVKKCVELIRIC